MYMYRRACAFAFAFSSRALFAASSADGTAICERACVCTRERVRVGAAAVGELLQFSARARSPCRRARVKKAISPIILKCLTCCPN